MAKTPVGPFWDDMPPGVGSSCPSGMIAMWHGTIANIPSGWVICDGNNSTPNLLAKFVESVPNVGTDPGATGGATSKTTAGHQHETPFQKYQSDLPGGPADVAPFGTGTSVAISKWYSVNAVSGNYPRIKVSSETDSISDIRPLYYDVAFIMKT